MNTDAPLSLSEARQRVLEIQTKTRGQTTHAAATLSWCKHRSGAMTRGQATHAFPRPTPLVERNAGRGRETRMLEIQPQAKASSWWD